MLTWKEKCKLLHKHHCALQGRAGLARVGSVASLAPLVSLGANQQTSAWMFKIGLQCACVNSEYWHPSSLFPLWEAAEEYTFTSKCFTWARLGENFRWTRVQTYSSLKPTQCSICKCCLYYGRTLLHVMRPAWELLAQDSEEAAGIVLQIKLSTFPFTPCLHFLLMAWGKVWPPPQMTEDRSASQSKYGQTGTKHSNFDLGTALCKERRSVKGGCPSACLCMWETWGHADWTHVEEAQETQTS